MTRQIVVGVWAAVLLDTVDGCAWSNNGESEKGRQMPQRTIEQIQEARTAEWMAIPGVEGTAIGLFKSKPCIKIFASVKAEQLRKQIPEIIEGYPVNIEETGTFRALDQSQ